MPQHLPIFLHACIPSSVLRAIDSAQGIAHWRTQYPALAKLDQMSVEAHVVALPDQCPNTALHAYLLTQLNLPIDTGLALPQAAMQNMPIIDSPHQQWHRLSLVHWRAGRDKVHLLPLTNITQAESQQLLAFIKPWLLELGWHIHESTPQTYFIQSHTPFDYIAPSLEVATSDQLEHFLPQGNNLKTWQTLLTEIQMAWFNHPVNQAREALGELSINSIWLDGMSNTHTWTREHLANWATLTAHVHHCQQQQIEQHLQELNDLFAPLLTQAHPSPIEMVFIGEGWHQTTTFTSSTLLSRIKNKLTRRPQKVLHWLSIPTLNKPTP